MTCTSGGGRMAEFPVGLRVLVVDDDVICLRVLEQMLRKCLYIVTSCSQATVALNLLRERKGCFDIVLSDVHMPDMDGFRLLELVGLEMDLPVIMMSADGRTNLVMRGIKHGACDYLIKPIRDEELKNIWQHVVRKKWNGIKEHEHSASMDDHDRKKRVAGDADCASSANEGSDEAPKTQKKRRESHDEDDSDMENDESTAGKKPRVVWSVELHQQFVCAVNQLGIEKAVPKRILELMNVPGLTRENVASHLQKFRLYLRRLSGVSHQQTGLTSYSGPTNRSLEFSSLGRFDMQALAASGQIPLQTLAAVHSDLLSRTAAADQLTLLHPSLHGSKSSPLEPAYRQPLIKCTSSISRPISQPFTLNKDVRSEFVSWSGKNPADVAPRGNLEHDNTLISFVRPQKLVEPSRAITVQPSCLVVPSQSTSDFRGGNISPDSENQNSSFRNPFRVNYSIPSRFAIDEHELTTDTTSRAISYANSTSKNKVKLEPNVDLMGIPVGNDFPQVM